MTIPARMRSKPRPTPNSIAPVMGFRVNIMYVIAIVKIVSIVAMATAEFLLKSDLNRFHWGCNFVYCIWCYEELGLYFPA